MNADDIISNAQRAKQFISNADVDPLPDELLIRASVAFSMLVRQGVIVVRPLVALAALLYKMRVDLFAALALLDGIPAVVE